MTIYKYKAFKNKSEFVEGKIDAFDLKEARKKILELGFTPTKVYDESGPDPDFVAKFRPRKLEFNLDTIIYFTNELTKYLSSGTSILQALHVIGDNALMKGLPQVSAICSDLETCIKNKMTFSHALETYYVKTFGNVYIKLIKTGELSGKLVSVLQRISYILNKKNKYAIQIYFLSFYLVYVMVVFIKILSKTAIMQKNCGGMWVPGALMTLNEMSHSNILKFFIDVTTFFSNNILGILITTGYIIFSVWLLSKVKSVKENWDKFILKIPVISHLAKNYYLTNLMYILQISYDVGMPLPEGLELCKETVSNSYIKNEISKSVYTISNGNTMSEAFASTDILPKKHIGYIAAGEHSGKLGDVFKDLCNTFERNFESILKIFIRICFVTLIAVLGIVIGTFGLGIVQSIFGVSQSIIQNF